MNVFEFLKLLAIDREFDETISGKDAFNAYMPSRFQ